MRAEDTRVELAVHTHKPPRQQEGVVRPVACVRNPRLRFAWLGQIEIAQRLPADREQDEDEAVVPAPTQARSIALAWGLMARTYTRGEFHWGPRLARAASPRT